MGMIIRTKSDPIIIIGAGMAGLTAARLLSWSKLSVLVLEKGRGVGGGLDKLEICPVDVRTWLENLDLKWEHRNPAGTR